jgi:hypothetical protein
MKTLMFRCCEPARNFVEDHCACDPTATVLAAVSGVDLAQGLHSRLCPPELIVILGYAVSVGLNEPLPTRYPDESYMHGSHWDTSLWEALLPGHGNMSVLMLLITHNDEVYMCSVWGPGVLQPPKTKLLGRVLPVSISLSIR